MTAALLRTTGPPAAPDVPAADFRAAMSALAAPVTVVTAHDAAGAARGLTVSAVSSLSLKPPLFLVCIDRGSRTHDALVEAPAFCVNVLSPGEEDLVRRFAGPAEHRFTGVRVVEAAGTAATRPPGLAAAALRLTCVHHAVADGGDHTILIGRVTAVEGDTRTAGGLLWHRRDFAHALPVPP